MRFFCTLSLAILFVVPGHSALAFDWDLEGRFKAGSSLVFDAPAGQKNFDSETELRLGVLGNILSKDRWNLDYELSADAKYADGPSVQSGLREETDVDFFRAWLRWDNGNLQLRGGRQKILFGSGSIFRPLGLFDTRDVTGVVPETRGVDSFRATYFLDETTSVEGWVVPAKANARMIAGMRWEGIVGGVESGWVVQYHPKTKLNDLADFSQEMIQLGTHLKGEYHIAYWNESRLDIERNAGEHPLRFDTVFGADYTFDVGEGLHVLAEYFFTTRQRDFTQTDLKGQRSIHQFGLLLDQPVGMNVVWQLFALFDARDGSFQIVPQLEYSLTSQAYLYLHGRFGDSFSGADSKGRFFKKTSAFNGSEPILGLTLVVYF